LAYIIYTDGSCPKNDGKHPGGWACVILSNDTSDGKPLTQEVTGGELVTTNNRMELMAVIQSLEHIPEGSEAIVHCDSAYVVNCFRDKWYVKWQRNGWISAAGTPVDNKDLWERLITVVGKNKVTFQKVKGHSTNELNNRCDELAGNAVPPIVPVADKL